MYRQGIKAETIHEQSNRLLDDDLPCQHSGRCPFIEKLNINASEYDVLLGHYLHAYQTGWIKDRYVAIDEFPGDAYVQEFTGRVGPAVTAYVDQEDGLPFYDYEDILERRAEFRDEIETWKNKVWSYYDSSHVLGSANSSAHSLGPLMTLANLEMERLDNRWQYADLGDGKVAARSTEHEWSFLLPPDLDEAESVVALDGTPVVEMWELVLGQEIERLSIHDKIPRDEYLDEILSLELIQTTENWNAYQSGEGVAPTIDIPVVEKIGELHNRKPGVITSKKGLSKYEMYGWDSMVSKVEYYGKMKGKNSFSTIRLGIVLGNPHPGDDVIEKWSAFAGRSAERREGTSGKDTDYGSFGNQVLQGLVQNEVLQAAMRFGREEKNGEKGATVFVHTSALPDWMEPTKRLVSVDTWLTPKDGMRQVIEAIYDIEDWRNQEWKTGDVAKQVSLSVDSARKHQKTLVKQGYLDSWQGGRGNAFHFSNVNLEEAPRFGHVEFPE